MPRAYKKVLCLGDNYAPFPYDFPFTFSPDGPGLGLKAVGGAGYYKVLSSAFGLLAEKTPYLFAHYFNKAIGFIASKQHLVNYRFATSFGLVAQKTINFTKAFSKTIGFVASFVSKKAIVRIFTKAIGLISSKVALLRTEKHFKALKFYNLVKRTLSIRK